MNKSLKEKEKKKGKVIHSLVSKLLFVIAKGVRACFEFLSKV